MVTLSWAIPLGEIDQVVALTFEEGNHLGMVTFSDRGAVAPGSVTVDLYAPAAWAYIARPWLFLLDERGQRKQTVCWCFARS